jgi:hypothetical protein
LTVVRSWVDQLRPLMIVWLLLTLPVVCHHETAVVLLTAAAAGHEHQHMMAEAAGEHGLARATHQHDKGHAQGPAPPAADDSPSAAQAQPGAPLQWRAYQATPIPPGLPTAADGVAFAAPTDLALPARPETSLRQTDVAAPDPQRRAPPAPPPRAFLG